MRRRWLMFPIVLCFIVFSIALTLVLTTAARATPSAPTTTTITFPVPHPTPVLAPEHKDERIIRQQLGLPETR